MLELLVRAAFSALVKVRSMDSKAARDNGIDTAWLDQEKRLAITINPEAAIRGKCRIDELNAEV